MIRVMVVDDSPLVRKIARDILNKDPDVRVAATAATAEFALAKLDRERPDVITMDMEMPGIGGVEAIRKIMSRRPTPIIVLSAHARHGADLTLQALEAGAFDFILKPSASLSGRLDVVAAELIDKVKGAVHTRMHSEAFARRPRNKAASTTPETREPECSSPGSTTRRAIELIAIGTSTGGPVALKEVLSALPGDFPVPIVVVQHMPPVFTRAFSARLNTACRLTVKEAEPGDTIVPGRVLVAPGDYHMVVRRSASLPHIMLERREQVSGHRPSVDVLMDSVGREYGKRAVGVIMTGMGTDGAAGMHELRRRGGYVISQDKDSSVIFGMNREVIRNGDADLILSLDRIATALIARAFPSVSAVR